MSRKITLAAFAVAATAIMLIAPIMFVDLALARPPLAAAAGVYETNASCSGPAMRGLPPPTRPIPDSMRNGAPCAVSGAMVTEKDTLSEGTAGNTHYVLGLRSDTGDEFVVRLEGENASNLWTSTQGGDRVLIQTVNGGVALVGDGTRTVRTEANPAAAAGQNELALWITGAMCVLELLAVAILVAFRRRAASAV
jgi:hypothetical protein